MIFSKSLRLWSVPLMCYFPLDVSIWSGSVKLPSTKILTISIWFSIFDYLTIFSIFWLEILVTIFSRVTSYFSRYCYIYSEEHWPFCFLYWLFNILLRLSTISLCLVFILFLIGTFSSSPVNLFDQILCFVNFSRVYLTLGGIMTSELIPWLWFSSTYIDLVCLFLKYSSSSSSSPYFYLYMTSTFCSKLSILCTYSIRISSPVMTIFCFSFLASERNYSSLESSVVAFSVSSLVDVLATLCVLSVVYSYSSSICGDGSVFLSSVWSSESTVSSTLTSGD